jgi:hypothetical protein
MSELLREDQGHHEIAEQAAGNDQTDDVLRTHSFSTPLTTSASTANTAIVTTTNTRSDISGTLRESSGEAGTVPA